MTARDDASVLRAYARGVASLAGGSDVDITALPAGERHLAATVSWRTRDGETTEAVVRINTIPAEKERQKAAFEGRVLAALNGRLAPRLLHFDDAGRWTSEPGMVLSYVAGAPIPSAELTDEHCRILGARLACLHDLDVVELGLAEEGTFELRANLWRRVGRDLVEKFPATDPAEAATLVERFWHAATLATVELLRALTVGAFDGLAPLSLLQGDLGPDNVLWNEANEPTFIDWEDARLGDPAEEVAYVLTENRLDARRGDAFLEGYAGALRRPVEPVLRRVAAWRSPTAVASAGWWLDRLLRMRSDDDATNLRYVRMADERLRFFEQEIAPRLAGAEA